MRKGGWDGRVIEWGDRRGWLAALFFGLLSPYTLLGQGLLLFLDGLAMSHESLEGALDLLVLVVGLGGDRREKISLHL